MPAMVIPIIDLKEQYKQVQEEIEAAVLKVLRSGHYILGPEGRAMEEEMADYLGSKYAVAVNSGTTALHLALAAAGVGPGDEVITTPFTFIATAEAISYLGAKPVFVDIDPITYCIDPSKIEEKINSKTQAIIPVHLYGHAADMYQIEEVADKYDLAVIEDCAQAISTEYNGKKVGTFGNFGCFSFFPTKNLGAAGEGGLITTNDNDAYERLKALRIHGSIHRYQHEIIGYNARLNEIQCAVLRIKLRYLDGWAKKRQANAARFNEQLSGLPVITPQTLSYSNHVYHQYAVQIKNTNNGAGQTTRDTVLSKMIENDILCAVHYPKPIHLQPAYKFLEYKEGSLPVSEEVALKIMSLPVYPELTEEQLETITAVFKKALKEAS
ncbi:MAG: DegT/DnrJ/EryC1/StrS family aminotransferase [Candidatus Margulisiibacteriota bacterium]